ncbi:hypothetical protein [Arthrobacter sp. FW306-2-2C-D06B]|uniref:hypothetical protein n=1 Tax=Arthrobacter sp. FW306-2-2C-D06B TaxID=2879618 RepID=UPI001F203FB1|nr:hypothetical protein [Arthrobacter sp. FW306-2-2C-D06B]UKA59164.1 hypothetical protein LFT47_02070 [Arthrobacter sp. FW306-2-2C-D06B]
MSRILNTHVSLWDPSGDLAILEPGTELPEWAEGRIGDHCLVPEVEAKAPGFTAPEVPPADAGEGGGSDSEDAGDGDPDDESQVDAGEADNVDPAAKAEAPDFTTPAPRRGRPRKA